MSADTQETETDAITGEEITGTTIPADDTSASTSAPRPSEDPQATPMSTTSTAAGETTTNRPNAFDALMSPKKPKPTSNTAVSKKSTTIPSTPHTTFPGRDGLGAYIHSPSSFPASRVLSHSPSWVLIRDRYPKSSVHLLLLPRDATLSRTHPLTALQTNPQFLAAARAEAAVAVRIAASELRRLHTRTSAGDAARTAAMDAGAPAPLPPGRDWTKDIRVGVHAGPSMAHLHIHVISCDMHAPALKHRKHYNSFCTPFFVRLEEFPLPEDDRRMESETRRELLARDLRCWRCGRAFGGRFAALKEHLEEEWEEWRRE